MKTSELIIWNPSEGGWHPSDNYKLQVKSANCNCYKYYFFVKIIREWNDLPANVVEIGNLRRFKIALKSYMCIS